MDKKHAAIPNRLRVHCRHKNRLADTIHIEFDLFWPDGRKIWHEHPTLGETGDLVGIWVPTEALNHIQPVLIDLAQPLMASLPVNLRFVLIIYLLFWWIAEDAPVSLAHPFISIEMGAAFQ